MTYWYWHVRQLNILWPTINIDGTRIVVFPTVYKPLENEHACVEYVEKGDRVLDLGCGTGVSAVFAAAIASDVLAVDISPAALENARENCRLQGVQNVRFASSDMFSNVEGKFNVIMANPPYIEADFEDDEEQFATSTRYLPILFAEVGKHLEDDGRLIVQYPGWFAGLIKRLATQNGLEVIKVERLPRKSMYLQLLSIAYMQMFFRSTLYLIRKRQVAKPAAEARLVADKRVLQLAD
jgi:methylase of polypeptide subunit release factors